MAGIKNTGHFLNYFCNNLKIICFYYKLYYLYNMKATSTQKPAKRTQGMNWISQHKRLAIYLRDGIACCYCGACVTDGAKLTLDHIKPYSKGGGNEATNLVTCCDRCNSSRGNRPVTAFVGTVAAYLGNNISADCILEHINNCRKRILPLAEAKEMIARQGSCFKALQNI